MILKWLARKDSKRGRDNNLQQQYVRNQFVIETHNFINYCLPSL